MTTKVKMYVSIASPDWSYVPQQEVELDDELALTWDAVGHCEIIGKSDGGEDSPADIELDDKLKTLGGSWYELPGGIKVQGKVAAIEALLAELEGGESNGAESDNTASGGTIEPRGSEATPKD